MDIQINKDVQFGEGGFGSVFLGTYQNREVAVKRIVLTHATDKDNEQALQNLNHNNVVKLFHFEEDDNFKYFALERCAASLDQIFLRPEDRRKYKGPKLPDHLNILSQLATGLEYIHSKKLIHRDIKPGNVLISVDSTGQITMKLADFGLSRTVNDRGTFTMNSGVKGTKNWYAPELLKLLIDTQPNTMEQPRGTVKSDVFSLGLVIAFLILDGQHLYGSTEIDIVNNIMEGNMVNTNSNYTTYIAYELIQKMLKSKLEDRISSSVVVEQLKYIQVKPEEKELEKAGVSGVCAIRDPVVATLSLSETNPIETFPNFIQQGVDIINNKDDDGNNLLHFLCGSNSNEKIIDTIKLLIERGFDVNEKNKDGWNALHFLCGNNSSEKLIDAIKLLIDLGIDVNEKSKGGWNALHFLCSHNSSEKLIDAINLLIQVGIDVNGKDNIGRNALHLMCINDRSKGLIEAIKKLIELKIDVNSKDDNGRNALHFLCSHNSSEKLIDAIKLLIDLGIDVNGKGNDGWNALHFLCGNNSSEKLIDAMTLLIQSGIDVIGTDKNGCNALHLLYAKNSSRRLKDAAQLLVQHGIDVNCKNNYGRKALDYLSINNEGLSILL